MPVDVVLPELGESVTDAILVEWLKSDGEAVAVDEPLAVIETDKADVELPAPSAGVLHTLKADGDTIEVGETIATIDEDGKAVSKADVSEKVDSPEEPVEADGLSPAVRRLVTEHDLDPAAITGTGKDGRLTKGDVLAYLDSEVSEVPDPPVSEPEAPAPPPAAAVSSDGERREPMSQIRTRIAERLVSAQQTAAMLTTFNEVDMSGIFDLRAKYKEMFADVHGISLGLMSFFVRACVIALQEYPDVNASIDGSDIVYRDYVNMGIAVGTDRGLVVPVLKSAERMSFATIESEIKRVALSAREGKLGLDELSGGTFTITNGGVFGSLLSTPILNPPQTGILGMHAIQNRPVAVGDEVVVRPMMYLALTYDHRLIDGQTSVTFLVRVKDLLEDPARMMLEV
ncbi:MAG: 2-oxoglutarate dehydrogenase complex dihydrolipoyllysine-residue succinyltransferase [Gemmatimonadetes bacterium]|nr:2-oxoglutarate dehydrogenase complex dihydrolipoyllysine-residue succinyltransferase [Gemmatimonadota bacterium]MYF75696.1 2-oxoglutarate dehydrogenase complex dihydrolipoyllysine-residue succinyltransferase [Gemmatimonadota bacterium]MYK50282.1 2-oxoglutarate dehydrogenase complex dihydrolipoyllysine-residue succinyltransferase [Gemmatimonadota bacterium]